MSAPFTDLGSLATHLRGLAQAQAPIVLDGSILDADTASQITTAFALPGGAPLTVSGVAAGDVPDPADNQLTISTGTAPLLGLTDRPVTLTFSMAGTALQVNVAATMPSAWVFADSFAALDIFPFTDLTFTAAQFVFSSAGETSYPWPTTGGPGIVVAPGQNFLSEVALGGVSLLATVLGRIIGSGSVPIYGPFAPTAGQSLPVGTLTAPLGSGSFGIGSAPNTLSLDNPRVAVQIGTSDDANPVQDVDLLVLGDFQQTLQVSLSIPVTGSSYAVSTTPLPGDASVSKLIESLPGGADFTGYLPSEIKSLFSEVGLDNFAMVVDTTPSVTYLGLAISTVKPWKVIDGVLELEGLNLVIESVDPARVNWERVMIAAQADFLPHIFTGEFDFTVGLEKQQGGSWEIGTVAGRYFGAVNLGDLVAGLLKSADSVPQALRDITFADFGVSATRASATDPFTWTCFGTTSVAFPLLDIQVTASLNLVFSKTADSYSVALSGSMGIGQEAFTLSLDLGTAGSQLTATWASTGDPLEFGDVAASLGWTDMPAVPPALDLGLVSAGFSYDFGAGTLVLSAASLTYGNAVFATLTTGGTRGYYFILDTGKSFSLSNLPLVGEELAKIEDISIGKMVVTVASAPMTADTATTVNQEIAGLEGTYPTFPAAGLTGTLLLTAQLQFGSETLPLSLSLGGGSSSGTAAGSAGNGTATTGTGTPGGVVTAGAGSAGNGVAAIGTGSAGTAVATTKAGSVGTGTAATGARSAGTGTAATGAGSAGTGAATTGTPGGAVTASSTPDGAHWYTVQRSFGPVSIQRIGAMYQSAQQTLWFEIDATLAFGPLSLSLTGLGVGSPLTTFAPEFLLQGLGVSYSVPPLQVAGSLVNLAPPGAAFLEFEGGVTVGTGDLTLTAFGFYGNDQGFPSLFIFGDLAHPFGGPPAFFLTGVALGFGYNSQLAIPTIDQVTTFPFVQVLPTSVAPRTGVFGDNPTPLSVLTTILGTSPPWVVEQKGALWFAAGITFTSFELVNSQALLIVEPGDDLVIALVGSSRAQFPQEGGTLYAYVELDLEARFAPKEGVFSVQAVLAPSSFVLDQACVLTGGFAFFVWYGPNPHAGDFVLTLGGYNPGFTPPSWYPTVPQVGFHWSLDSSITVSGGAYFALTPAALMLGGRLDATYQAGNLKAWFDAHADVVIRWKPFWFQADIGITIGASYRLDLLFTTATFRVELGCDLSFWGPPTGGSVTVDWYIISFTIPFGTPNSGGTQISGWPDVEAMLPNAGTAAAPTRVSLTPTAGLIPAGTAPASDSSSSPAPASPGAPTSGSSPSGAAMAALAVTGQAVQGEPAGVQAAGGAAPPAADGGAGPWLVRGSQFSFTTGASIPASAATVGGAHAFNGSAFNVHPLQWAGVTATHDVTITDGSGKDVSSSFSAVPVQNAVPASLWGSPPESGGNPQVPSGTAQLVPGQLVGVAITVNPLTVGASAGAVDVLAYLSGVDLTPAGTLAVSAQGQPQGDLAANPGTVVSLIAGATGIASQAAATARGDVLAALSGLGYAPATANDPMTGLAAGIGCALQAEPLLVSSTGPS